MGWGKIKDVVIRPGCLAVAMVIQFSELSNPIIREGPHIVGSTLGKTVWVSRGTIRSVYIVHGAVVTFSP